MKELKYLLYPMLPTCINIKKEMKPKLLMKIKSKENGRNNCPNLNPSGRRRRVGREEYQDKTCKLQTKFGKMEGKTTRRKHLNLGTRFQEARMREVPDFEFERGHSTMKFLPRGRK
jgi:hypothetical protein